MPIIFCENLYLHYNKNMVFCQKITPFQKAVYKAISGIPFGETRSYQWVAREIGNPKAIRAIGNALKKNPYPVAIPCHRVIRKDGSLGGYCLGKELKKNLLDWEENILT